MPLIEKQSIFYTNKAVLERSCAWMETHERAM